MDIILQLWIPLISSVITIITGLGSVVRYVTAHKKQGRIKDHSFKDVAGYILIPIFLILTGIIVYLGNETNFVLWISFAISLISVIYLIFIARLSFNATEIIAPEWLWKLVFNQISTRFEDASKSEINVLLLYANDCENQAKEIQSQNEENSPIKIFHFNCKGKTCQDLNSLIEANTFFGIYILLSPELEKEQYEWYFDCCQNWANRNMDKPIVYTNLNTNSRLHFGKVSNKNYKYGILRLFERTYQRADLWEQQSKNYRNTCATLLIILFLGIGFSAYLRHIDTKFKNELERYDANYSKRDLLSHIPEIKEVLNNNLPAGIFYRDDAKNNYFVNYTENVIKKICRVNNLNYEEFKNHVKLSYWKVDKNDVLYEVIRNVTELPKTEFKIAQTSIIGGAFFVPDNFILYKKNGGHPEKKAYKINTQNNSESLNEELAKKVSLFSTDDSEEIDALLVYCLKDFNDNMDERTGVCLDIRGFKDLSFIDKRITRAILRESIKEIHLFPRKLFLEQKSTDNNL